MTIDNYAVYLQLESRSSQWFTENGLNMLKFCGVSFRSICRFPGQTETASEGHRERRSAGHESTRNLALQTTTVAPVGPKADSQTLWVKGSIKVSKIKGPPNSGWQTPSSPLHMWFILSKQIVLGIAADVMLPSIFVSIAIYWMFDDFFSHLYNITISHLLCNNLFFAVYLYILQKICRLLFGLCKSCSNIYQQRCLRHFKTWSMNWWWIDGHHWSQNSNRYLTRKSIWQTVISWPGGWLFYVIGFARPPVQQMWTWRKLHATRVQISIMGICLD